MEDFIRPKIAWASVGETYYSLIECNMMLLDTNYFFAIKDDIYSYYLLGILNSNLITFWINSEDTQIGGGGAYRHYKYNLEKISIPIATDTSPIRNIVSQILECCKKGDDISDCESKLNELVYTLYDLSIEEISFIESIQREIKSDYNK